MGINHVPFISNQPFSLEDMLRKRNVVKRENCAIILHQKLVKVQIPQKAVLGPSVDRSVMCNLLRSSLGIWKDRSTAGKGSAITLRPLCVAGVKMGARINILLYDISAENMAQRHL